MEFIKNKKVIAIIVALLAAIATFAIVYSKETSLEVVVAEQVAIVAPVESASTDSVTTTTATTGTTATNATTTNTTATTTPTETVVVTPEVAH